ncbi:hypothetical protein HDU67_006980 [Dinochytrium kinnereticum]|nr:hypothetical protein HDU67_006980 [Dinochytrium kinnereticum]
MQRVRRRTDNYFYQKKVDDERRALSALSLEQFDGGKSVVASHSSDGWVMDADANEYEALDIESDISLPPLPVEVYLKVFSFLPPRDLLPLLRLSKRFHDIAETALFTSLPHHLPNLKALSTSLSRRIALEEDLLARTLLAPHNIPQSRDVDELRRYARPTHEVAGIMGALLALAPTAPPQADPIAMYTAHLNFPGGAIPSPTPRMMVGVAAFGLLGGMNGIAALPGSEDQWKVVRGFMNQPGFKPWIKRLANFWEGDVASEKKVRAASNLLFKAAKASFAAHGSTGAGSSPGGLGPDEEVSQGMLRRGSVSPPTSSTSPAPLARQHVFAWKDVSNALAVGLLIAGGAITSDTAFGEAVQAWISLPPLCQSFIGVDGLPSIRSIASHSASLYTFLPSPPTSPVTTDDTDSSEDVEGHDGDVDSGRRTLSPSPRPLSPTGGTGRAIQTLAEISSLCRRLNQSCRPAAKFLNLLLGISILCGRVRPLKRVGNQIDDAVVGFEKVMTRIRERRRGVPSPADVESYSQEPEKELCLAWSVADGHA